MARPPPGSGVMRAVATDMPRSRWRSVAMRRPGCTASLGVPERRAEQGGRGVEVGDGERQAEEPGRPVAEPSPDASPSVLGADQLEDHLAGLEERLAHRRAVGVGVAHPQRLEADRLERRGGAGRVGGEQHDVVDAQRCRWGASAGWPAAGVDEARVASPSSVPVGERDREPVVSRSDQSRMRLPPVAPDQSHPHRADAARAVVVDREPGGTPTRRAGRRRRSRRWSAWARASSRWSSWSSPYGGDDQAMDQ